MEKLFNSQPSIGVTLSSATLPSRVYVLLESTIVIYQFLGTKRGKISKLIRRAKKAKRQEGQGMTTVRYHNLILWSRECERETNIVQVASLRAKRLIPLTSQIHLQNKRKLEQP